MNMPFDRLCLRRFQDVGGFLILYGALAQLGERLLCKQNVAGSSPVRSTGPLV